jgi:citrate synthase
MNGANSSYWTTDVSDVDASTVFVRGYNLENLIGTLPFSGLTYLVIRGKIPTPGEARMMDVLLSSVLDYSLYKPGTVAARYCVSANPQMVPGLATAILSVGEYTLAPEDSGRFILDGVARWKAGGLPLDRFACEFVADLRANKTRVPGLGHPNFRFVDPRARKLKDVAIRENVWGELCDWYEAVHGAFIVAAGKPDIVINEVGMMAAILAQMGFAPAEMTGIAIMSSMPGVIAHISEELASKKRIRIVPDDIASYSRPRRELEADMEAAGWGSPDADSAGSGQLKSAV